jgi:phosphomannomutase
MIVESFSGIRGIYKEDLSDDIIRKYALAYAGFLEKKKRNKTVVIGMDTRPSSAHIKEEMKKAFLGEGFDVVDVGFNPTPAIQLGVRLHKAGGGVIISASHNEPEYNGWKFLSETGSVLVVDEIREVIRDSRKDLKEKNAGSGKDIDKAKELRKSYADFVIGCIGKKGIEQIKNAKLKVVVDPNGGAATAVIKDVMEKAGVDAIYKNMDLGVFNRLVEPNQKSLAYLAFYVEDLNADLGAGWDCDGDRVELVIPNDSEFVKRNGKMLSGQYILALLVEEVMSEYKGKDRHVVVNDATSNLVGDIAKRHNADVVEVEVGEINVVEKMYELKAPVGGEGSSSGGIFPPSRCRDGILTLLIILRLIAKRKKKLSRILEEFPQYYNSVTRARCPAEKAVAVRKEIEKYWKKQKFIKGIRKTGDETGGLKVIREDNGWMWFRQSKTEAGVFRIISDANSKEYADKLLAMGEKSFDDSLANVR